MGAVRVEHCRHHPVAVIHGLDPGGDILCAWAVKIDYRHSAVRELSFAQFSDKLRAKRAPRGGVYGDGRSAFRGGAAVTSYGFL